MPCIQTPDDDHCFQVTKIKPLTIVPDNMLGSSFTRRRMRTILNKLLKPNGKWKKKQF